MHQRSTRSNPVRPRLKPSAKPPLTLAIANTDGRDGGRPWIVTGSRARLARETTGWTRRSAARRARRRTILQLVARSELSGTRLSAVST